MAASSPCPGLGLRLQEVPAASRLPSLPSASPPASSPYRFLHVPRSGSPAPRGPPASRPPARPGRFRTEKGEGDGIGLPLVPGTRGRSGGGFAVALIQFGKLCK